VTCPVSACDLREPIAIQRETLTPDDRGGQVKTWTTIESPWAKVEDRTGRERDYGQQQQAESVYTVYIRYTDVTVKDRLVIRGENFNIRDIFPVDFKNQWQKIVAESGVGT